MPKRKKFNIHDLYPKDYCFDYEAFDADPEGYVFTQDDIAYSNAMELERYEREVPMSYYEKTLLRKWVMSGHSPYQNPGSRYLCPGSHDGYDFIKLYRMDKEIQHDMKGMSKKEQKAYLMEYMGWRDDKPSEDGSGFMEPSEWDQDHPFDL